MRFRNGLSRILIVSVAALGAIAGCGKKTDQPRKTETPGEHTDPHDVPLTDAEKKQLREDVGTYEQAVAHIKQFRDTIKKESTGRVPERAHRPLDKLDLVLEWLPDIARISRVPKNQWQTIGSNAQKLRERFNKVHRNIDDKKAPDYGAVAADIDNAVQALEAVKTK